MPLDIALLTYLLRTPETEEITTRLPVKALLADPANAGEIVPALGDEPPIARNARKILCSFESGAAPFVMAAAAASANLSVRKQSLEVFWTLLVGEDTTTIRAALTASTESLTELLRDESIPQNDLPAYVENDFTGRIRDFTYVIVQELLDGRFDQSTFRALDAVGRDAEIRQLRLPPATT